MSKIVHRFQAVIKRKSLFTSKVPNLKFIALYLYQKIFYIFISKRKQLKQFMTIIWSILSSFKSRLKRKTSWLNEIGFIDELSSAWKTLSERVQLLLSHLYYRRNKECKLSSKTARTSKLWMEGGHQHRNTRILHLVIWSWHRSLKALQFYTRNFETVYITLWVLDVYFGK